MTSVQATFSFDNSLGEQEASALARVTAVYGISGFKLDERHRRVIVDYDATRLQEKDIAFMLRNAGLHLQGSAGHPCENFKPGAKAGAQE